MTSEIGKTEEALASIGARLQACRQRAGLTQQQAADGIKQVPDAAGKLRELTRAAYAQWEVGLTSPDVERVRAAAQVLGVTPAYLAFGDESGQSTDELVWVTELGPDLESRRGSRWAIPRGIVDRLTDAPSELRFVDTHEDIAGTELVRGSTALLDTTVTSVAGSGVFAFEADGRLKIAAMAPRPASASRIMVRLGPVTFEEDAKNLNIRGQVVSALMRFR